MRRPSARSKTVRRSGSASAWFTAFAGPVATTVNFWLLLVLLAVCALGGGSSFADVPSLLYVRPLAVLVFVGGLLVPVRADWKLLRGPVLLLLLFAMITAAQLVPLPPSIWTALPGRTAYVPLADMMGIAQPWRPVSLAADLTWNSLAALIVPAAVLVNYARMNPEQRAATVPAIIILCCLSAALGVAQFAGGQDSPLYLYRRTYEGFTVGFLSNRNHHAVLLALVFPALRVWTLQPGSDRVWAQRRRWLALGLAVMIVPVILATGSRAGMALAGLSILITGALFPPRRKERSASPSRLALAGRVAIPIVLVLLIALSWVSGRAASIERLLSLSDVNKDFRFQFAPVMLRILAETFPVGTGLGSFDPVFRQYEPDAILKASYFNHAHNELLEIAIGAGLIGLLLVAALLVWWAIRTVVAVRTTGPTARLARLGAMAIAILLLASLVDYPLRAPFMASVFALACCWLCEREQPAAGGVARTDQLR